RRPGENPRTTGRALSRRRNGSSADPCEPSASSGRVEETTLQGVMKTAEPKTAAPACLDDRIMDGVASDSLIKWAVGEDCDEDTRDTLERELNDFAAELASPTSSRVERTLAELAALDWFALRVHQAKYANRFVEHKGMPFDQSEHAQRRIDRTHRRLISTL